MQAILGDYYPESLQALLHWYCVTFHDPLMRNPPTWFKSFIWCELFLQLPFFFIAAYALMKKKDWIRIPAIVYGVHVATTVVPILAEIIFNKFVSDSQKFMLIGFYYPYLLIPAILAVYMCLNAEPFGKRKSK